MARRRSSRMSARASAAPYARRGSSAADDLGAGSTGLTAYVAGSSLSFNEEEGDEAPSELNSARGTSARGGGLTGAISSALSFRPGKATAKHGAPMELTLFKPNADDTLGVTFEVPADESLKGVVVAVIHPGFLVSNSKKLKEGDVVHVINGRAVTTPMEGASFLKEASGLIQLVITRAGAKARGRAGDEAGGELGAADKTRSFLPMHLPSSLSFAHGGRGKKKEAESAASAESAAAAAGSGEAEPNATVVVSCSQLIVESKRIIGAAAGLDATLDDLYSQLKAKTIASQAALGRLIELVGQTTVEQAGLVIANAHKGALADGWVEYYDKESAQNYYYNVHTKATTWSKPVRQRPPPPPPPKRRKSIDAAPAAAVTATPDAAGSGEGPIPMDSDEEEDLEGGDPWASRQAGTPGGAIRHGVAEAIAARAVDEARATRAKMVEEVRIEVSHSRHGGPLGLQSVSL